MMVLRGRQARFFPVRAWWTALFAAALLASGCQSMETRPRMLHLRIDGIAAKNFSYYEQRFELELWMDNPNTFQLEIASIEYRLFVNGREFGTGTMIQLISIPANSGRSVRLAVNSDLRTAFEHLSESWKSSAADLRLKGSVALLQFGRYPFDVGVPRSPKETIPGLVV